MTIVVGVDGSETARQAARVAAKLAVDRGEELRLVAVSPAEAPELLARELADQLGVSVEACVRGGAAAQALVDEAETASTIWLGSRGPRRWGSVAKALAGRASTPVVSVRQPERWQRWLAGTGTLEVLTPVLLEESAPLAWADRLATSGPVQTTLVHVVWPPDEHYRKAASPGPLPLEGLTDEDEARLLAEMRRHAPPAPAGVTRTFRVIPGWGRVDGHVSSAARELDPDLVVVGARALGTWERLRLGSVSRGLLTHAPWNVAVVPSPETSSA